MMNKTAAQKNRAAVYTFDDVSLQSQREKSRDSLSSHYVAGSS